MNFRKLSAIATVFGLAALMSACDAESPVDSLNKRESFAFLHNETSHKVTVSYERFDSLQTFVVGANETLEISDIHRWNLTQSPEDVGKVTFTFDNDSSYIQTCELVNASSTEHHDRYTFAPEENNILDLDLMNEGGWTVTHKKGNKVHYDYYIK